MLDDLLGKMAGDQWSAEQAVQWETKIVPPMFFRRRTYIRVVSQFYHGEMMVCRMLDGLIPQIGDARHRRFLELQMAEERRHAQVFKTYIERLGVVAPVEEALGRALEDSLAWKGAPLGLIAAFHVVFEGGAVGLIEKLAARFPCPLFRQINARVLIDEARHVAFGINCLRQGLGGMEIGEREELYQWIKAVWARSAVESRRRYSWPVALVTRLGADWFDETWQRQERILRQALLPGPA
ncbi:MAG: ferritin-like domain-containing protein [Rhodospirillales bacterium]|jgi:hypothetical protein|nr:ferritin-like domain-containing protein [Rhodospirillales bacterium]